MHLCLSTYVCVVFARMHPPCIVCVRLHCVHLRASVLPSLAFICIAFVRVSYVTFVHVCCVCVCMSVYVCAQKVECLDASRHKRISVCICVPCLRTFGMYYTP